MNKLYVYCTKKEFNGMFFTIAESKKEMLASDSSYIITDIKDMERFTFSTYIEDTPAHNIKVIYNDKYNAIVEYRNSCETYRVMINYEYNHIKDYSITMIK